MQLPFTHIANYSFRWLSAVTLTTVYLLIVLSPLASLAMNSKTFAHTVTGECSGDCNICGCSPESRANHTCCCAKMKRKQAEALANKFVSGDSAHCEKSCCSKSTHLQNRDDTKNVVAQKTDSEKNETVFKCGCPCGKNKLLSIISFGTSDLLPITFSERTEPQHVETLFINLTYRLTSCHSEPPVPPPRFTFNS